MIPELLGCTTKSDIEEATATDVGAVSVVQELHELVKVELYEKEPEPERTKPLCFKCPEGPERHLNAAKQKLPRDNFCCSVAAQLSTPNMTGRRFHRTMEMIPARPW